MGNCWCGNNKRANWVGLGRSCMGCLVTYRHAKMAESSYGDGTWPHGVHLRRARVGASAVQVDKTSWLKIKGNGCGWPKARDDVLCMRQWPRRRKEISSWAMREKGLDMRDPCTGLGQQAWPLLEMDLVLRP